jgi:Protein of unknown function (DUF3011)
VFNTKSLRKAAGWIALGVGGILWSLSATAVHAQDRGESRVVCASNEGQRTVCPADTRNGVQFERQIGDVRCIEGYTWGYTEQGIWVDRGCRAEFSVPQVNARPYGERRTRIDSGTVIAVRTNEPIDSDRSDGRIFTGVVDQDVLDNSGRPAIFSGSNVELLVRVASDNDLIIDLESIMINGQRYAIRAESENVDSARREGVGKNGRTGAFLGGGAALGAIIGAIAGGGKGAAVGAAAGAAAGAGTQIITRGRRVRVPSESILTFRLARPLLVGIPDPGIMRDGFHYHEYRD